jgi:hypothetical protein
MANLDESAFFKIKRIKRNSVFWMVLYNTHDMANLYEKTNLDE